MAFRKIKLKVLKQCPSCGGKSGIGFSLRARAVCTNRWGNDPADSTLEKTEINQDSKTARCLNCGKRFEIMD